MRRVNAATIDVSQAPADLTDVVASIAAHPAAWMDRVRFRVDRRWYERLRVEPDYDVWLITWLPGQATGFHDHGASSGAFAVASGVLEEEGVDQKTRLVSAGDVRTFGPVYAHDVRNPSMAPAISIHAYSPPLTTMTHYERDEAGLVPVASSHAPDKDGNAPRRIDQLLATARARLHRVTAVEAYAAVAEDTALLVDIRPAAQRAAEGEIPGALVIERNVLEWRFDPTSEARLAVATAYDLPVIVICSEGTIGSMKALSALPGAGKVN